MPVCIYWFRQAGTSDDFGSLDDDLLADPSNFVEGDYRKGIEVEEGDTGYQYCLKSDPQHSFDGNEQFTAWLESQVSPEGKEAGLAFAE